MAIHTRTKSLKNDINIPPLFSFKDMLVIIIPLIILIVLFFFIIFKK